jgi:hypothetical protein
VPSTSGRITSGIDVPTADIGDVRVRAPDMDPIPEEIAAEHERMATADV